MAFLSQMSTSIEEVPWYRNENKAKEGEDASSPVDSNLRLI